MKHSGGCFEKDVSKSSGIRDFKMKYFFLCTFLSLLSFTAWAEMSGDRGKEKDTGIHQASPTATLIEHNNQVYASAIFGNGAAYGKNVTGERTMEWRALETRFGKEMDISDLHVGRIFFPNEKLRFDLIYYNEGHPENNHRDGFGLQVVYRKPLNRKLNAEFGIGPYYSMNTTTLGGIQYNDSHLGVLLSLALRVGLDHVSPGMDIRLALNHVTMPGAHSSNALLVGVGKHFNDSPSHTQPEFSGNPIWLGVAGINAQTNHSHIDNVFGVSAEAKKYHGQWALSFSGIVEGDDGVRVDRYGVAAQGWFVQPLTEKWTVSAGFGPYIAANRRESGNALLLGLFTFQIERFIAKDWQVFASFSRVHTFRERNDRDLIRVGIMRQFGS